MWGSAVGDPGRENVGVGIVGLSLQDLERLLQMVLSSEENTTTTAEVPTNVKKDVAGQQIETAMVSETRGQSMAQQ